MTPQERDYRTEVIPPVPPAVPDPFPPSALLYGRPETGRFRQPRRPVRDRSGTTVRFLLQLLAVAVLLAGAFVAGQVTAQTGVVPPPPVPRAAASVITDAQMARVWPAMAYPDQATVCESWQAGAWREYITDRWVSHLHSPAGGGIDVDRATVADFIGRACAGFKSR